MWLGKPGNLISIPDPNPGVTATTDRQATVHTTIGGRFRVDYPGAAPRTWNMIWGGGPRYLSDDQYDTLEQIYFGGGPLVLLPYSSRGAKWNYVTSATGSLTSILANSMGNLSTNSVYLGFVTPPSTAWSFALQALKTSVEGTSQTGLIGIRWLDITGASVGTAVESAVQTLGTVTWKDFTITGTAPSTAVYGIPYVKVTSSAATTISWRAARLEIASSSGAFRQPRGMPVVSFTELSHVYNFSSQLTANGTLVDVN